MSALNMSRNLLICFDAFGTLFAPRTPVAQQYAEVATTLGLRNITEDKVQSSFRKAFKQESKANPNYGKKTGLGAEKWWSNVINNTFHPLISPGEQLPASLIPDLLHRFNSNEGYTLQRGARECLSHLRNTPRKRYDNIVVGVITNSDPRVPSVLSSLGLEVSPLRYGSGTQQSNSGQAYDIDFSVMSYDVGAEKPDKKIFQAAVEMLDPVLTSRGDDTTSRNAKDWERVYVGDDYAKDVKGANSAGWSAVLITPESLDDPETGTSPVKWLEDEFPGDLMLYLDTRRSAVGFANVQRIADWLKT